MPGIDFLHGSGASDAALDLCALEKLARPGMGVLKVSENFSGNSPVFSVLGAMNARGRFLSPVVLQEMDGTAALNVSPIGRGSERAFRGNESGNMPMVGSLQP